MPTNRGDLLDDTTAWLLVAHMLEASPRHVDQTEEVGFHLLSDLLVLQFFEAASEPVSCIVDYDVHATELLDGLLECILDRLLVCHVKPEAKEVLLGGVLEL